MGENTGGENGINVEKESGPVRRVAERVGRSLSETYTVKGAIAKEMRKVDKVTRSFTPQQQQEMRTYFSRKAEKSAKWKVIRNWVATGAGLAVGSALAFAPEQSLALVVNVAGEVGKWWTKTALPALGKAGAGISGAFAAAREAIGDAGIAVRDWLFDIHGKQPVIATIDKPKIVADWSAMWANAPLHQAIDATGQGLADAWNKGLQPFLVEPVGKFITEGPQLKVPTIRVIE